MSIYIEKVEPQGPRLIEEKRKALHILTMSMYVSTAFLGFKSKKGGVSITVYGNI